VLSFVTPGGMMGTKLIDVKLNGALYAPGYRLNFTFFCIFLSLSSHEHIEITFIHILFDNIETDEFVVMY
jgi:hypothetical protein